MHCDILRIVTLHLSLIPEDTLPNKMFFSGLHLSDKRLDITPSEVLLFCFISATISHCYLKKRDSIFLVTCNITNERRRGGHVQLHSVSC